MNGLGPVVNGDLMDSWMSNGLVGRVVAQIPVLLSAGLVALAIILAPEYPGVALLLVLASCTAIIPPVVARIRFRRILLSGDVERVLAAWRGALGSRPHAHDAEPLVAAIAFAAYGWVDEARLWLQRARCRRLAGATEEQRLFVQTLVEAFDGDRSEAVQMADAIAALPVPDVGARLQRRVILLRSSLGALARAFAHTARPGDLEVLEAAAHASPLVSWAMRYAAAIVAVDRNELSRARRFIDGAPSWPQESAFRRFHAELEQQLLLKSSPPAGQTHS